jgi:drug/metabolite transporter (DMT)-like permease
MTIRNWGYLLLLGAIWGASYLFLRIATPVLGAFVVSALRVVIAAAALCLYAAARQQLPDLRAHWRALLILGGINAALPFVVIAWATAQLNASMASILNATTPLFTALIAALWIREPLGWSRIAGLLLGLTGVAILVGWSPLGMSSGVLLGVAGSLIGAIAYAVGGVYAKVRFRNVPALGMAIGQQAAASIWLIPLGAATWTASSPAWSVIGSILGLSLLSTAFGYLIYFDLMERVGPTNTLSVTFLVPVFGTFWGVIFLDEPLRLSLIVGMLTILAGIFLVTGLHQRPKTSQEAT